MAIKKDFTDIFLMKHIETIVTHIGIVKDLCYQMGIPELGDSHDLSKFSPEEFEIYKYAHSKKMILHENTRKLVEEILNNIKEELDNEQR